MTQYVRVSEILARLFPYKDIDLEVLDAKAKIGTNVHQAIVDDCEGGFPVFDTDRAQAYFESYKMWRTRHKTAIAQVPRLYCDKLMITGECDGLVSAMGADILIDWKCSANANEEQWKMQAHFYWYLLRENGYIISENMRWINLRHRKRIKYGKNGQNQLIYDPLDPVVYEIQFDQNILDKCVEEAIRYWEEKSNAIVVA